MPLRLSEKNKGTIDLGDAHQFAKRYDIMQSLGQSHIEVESYLVNNRELQQVQFLKAIDFRKVHRGSVDPIEKLAQISHPSIVKTRGIYIDSSKIYLVSDYIAKTHQSLMNMC